MTNEKLGELFEAFAHYYWSIPLGIVIDRIVEWHPEVTRDQVQEVVNHITENTFAYHCSLIDEGVDDVELVTEHLVSLDIADFDRFISARIDGPYADCDEEMLLKIDDISQWDIPEIRDIIKFGKAELGLDEEWIQQLVDDCQFCLADALCEGKSWVMEFLNQERYGKIRFGTIAQVERIRDLGNKLYQVLPNPVLKGWRPVDLENLPVLLDEIPERNEDIPDGRAEMEKLRKLFGLITGKAKKKGGRNKSFGSGKKHGGIYKYHSVYLKAQLIDEDLWTYAVGCDMESPEGIRYLKDSDPLFSFLDEYFLYGPYYIQYDPSSERFVAVPVHKDHQGIGIWASVDQPGMIDVLLCWFPGDYTAGEYMGPKDMLARSVVYTAEPNQKLADFIRGIYTMEPGKRCTFPLSTDLVVTIEGNFVDKIGRTARTIRAASLDDEARERGEKIVEFIKSMKIE